MKTLAIIYIVLILLTWIATPFCFGEERKPYNAKSWAFNVIIHAPLVYLLWLIATL